MKDKRFNNVEMLKRNRDDLAFIRYEMHECRQDEMVSGLIPVDPEEFERIMAASGYTQSAHKVN